LLGVYIFIYQLTTNYSRRKQMKNIINHLSILGHKVRDRVTGFNGVATSVCFDLYGCIQVTVNPGMDPNGKLSDSAWFDIGRLEIFGDKVMPMPAFINDDLEIAAGNKGPSEKPKNERNVSRA
jgi:hypothetical protein